MKRSSDQSRRLVHEQSESELQHGAVTRIAPADETRVSRKIKSIIDNPKPKKICKNGPMSSEMAAQHDRNEENEEDEDEQVIEVRDARQAINKGLEAIRAQAREAEQLAFKLVDEKDKEQDKFSLMEQQYKRLEAKFNALQEQLSSREGHKDKHEQMVEEDKDLVYKRWPEFSGAKGENFESWIHQCEAFLQQDCYQNKSELKKVRAIRLGISGTASNILNAGQKDIPIFTVKDIFKILGQTYGISTNPVDLSNKTKCDPDESVREYYGRLRAHIAEAGLQPGTEIFDSVLLMHFERGLPLEIKSKLKLLYANTIQAAFAAALKIEATISMKKGSKQEPSAAINAIDDDVAIENETSKEFKKLKEEVMALREEAKQNQRAVKRPYYSSNNYYDNKKRRTDYDNKGGKRSNRMVCFKCNKPGHSFRNCKNASEKEKKEIEDRLPELLNKFREESLNSQRGSREGSPRSRQ